MKPNEVKEILKSIVQELALPVDVSNGDTLLIVEGDEPAAKQCKETLLERWRGEDELDDYKNRNTINGPWRMTHRSTLSEIHQKIEKLGIATARVLEVKEVLQSLITERELPFKVYYASINITILPENPSNYQTDDMIELETVVKELQQEAIFEENDLKIYVRHSGFRLYSEDDYIDVDFTQVQLAAQRLQSRIEKHGLNVRLLHGGFAIIKDREIEIHVSEVEELAFRLTVITGINYRVSSYDMGPNEGVKPRWTHEINWQEASLLNDRAYPYA